MTRITAAELKAQIAPRQFYTFELPLNRYPAGSGWVQWGLCPFHPHTRPGPFRVNVLTGAFYCHSCGAKGGSIIDFVMLRDGLDFSAALKRLRESWGGA